mmetsp:Transcript_38795/g.86690  ORF Transcript_38795/g.86690 Transcript_38795/m.86690 type:complete len:321 (-) Transcript_38795:67-1029(-)
MPGLTPPLNRELNRPHKLRVLVAPLRRPLWLSSLRRRSGGGGGVLGGDGGAEGRILGGGARGRGGLEEADAEPGLPALPGALHRGVHRPQTAVNRSGGEDGPSVHREQERSRHHPGGSALTRLVHIGHQNAALRFGGHVAALVGLVALSGGVSRVVWGGDEEDAEGGQRPKPHLLLRGRVQPASGRRGRRRTGLAAAREAARFPGRGGVEVGGEAPGDGLVAAGVTPLLKPRQVGLPRGARLLTCDGPRNRLVAPRLASRPRLGASHGAGLVHAQRDGVRQGFVVAHPLDRQARQPRVTPTASLRVVRAPPVQERQAVHR